MRLDFSALAQPVTKVRGQVGTTGTLASMRGCVSPPAQPGAGTTGGKPAAVALVADLVVAAPAGCPPVSPDCPQVTDPEKLNAGAVSPASPLVPTGAARNAAAPFESGDAAGKSTGASIIAKVHTAASDRPSRLTTDEADRSHAPSWDDAEIAAFMARTERFAMLGRADADNLAERLTLRDRDGDDRRLCLECTWLGDTGRCLAAATGRIPGTGRRVEPVQTILQRCSAFGLRKGLV